MSADPVLTQEQDQRLREMARHVRALEEFTPAELATLVASPGLEDYARRVVKAVAAFQLAFSEWSGFDDLVVGTPVANRTRQTARETMGYYAGIVPLRGQIDRSRIAADHLRAGHQQTIDSFANAIPFVELARALGEQSEAGYNPLFEVRFALQNHPMPEVSLPNLSARLSMRSTGTARFQLGCEITEAGDGLEVAWLFRENLFSRRDIENLDGIFQRVLAGICRSPENRISEVLNRSQ